MDALLQFEVDRKRWEGSKARFVTSGTGEDPALRLLNLVKTAAADTLNNGGTFVLVVTPDKVTMVQRAETEDLA